MDITVCTIFNALTLSLYLIEWDSFLQVVSRAKTLLASVSYSPCILIQSGLLCFLTMAKRLGIIISIVSKMFRNISMIWDIGCTVCSCTLVENKEPWKIDRRSTYLSVYALIDLTQNRHRFCSLQFKWICFIVCILVFLLFCSL